MGSNEDAQRSAPRRLTNLYPVGAAVEVLLADGEWHAGRVMLHDHPGVWVETQEGMRWFVTHGGRIRAESG